jgi:NAD+ kinase
MRVENVALIYSYDCDTLEHVQSVLTKKRINYKATKRDFLDKKLFQNQDLVIVIGGDGTFLRTTHFIKDRTPILGVNCNIHFNEGFFMRATRQTFEDKLERLKDRFIIQKLARLEVIIDDKKLPELSLNEVYAGCSRAYHVSEYRIHLGDREESQKSSGVLITTAAGSYAWAKSAGGFYLPLESTKFQYLVREPYQGRLANEYHLIKGLLRPQQQVMITSLSNDNIVVIDSNTQEYRLKEHSKLIVRPSKRYLNLINFLNK